MKKRAKKYYANKKESPLDQWSEEVDPAIMSGQHWERDSHSPEEIDIGWKSEENQDLLQGRLPQGGRFMHPVHDVSYDTSTARPTQTEQEEEKL